MPGYIERFKWICRNEVLNLYLFHSLDEVQKVAGCWLMECNDQRPNDVLDGLPQPGDSRLRAAYGLRIPDVIPAATAFVSRVDGMLINDRRLRRLESERIKVLLFDARADFYAPISWLLWLFVVSCGIFNAFAKVSAGSVMRNVV